MHEFSQFFLTKQKTIISKVNKFLKDKELLSPNPQLGRGENRKFKNTCQTKVNELTAKTLFVIFGLFWSFLATFACKNMV